MRQGFKGEWEVRLNNVLTGYASGTFRDRSVTTVSPTATSSLSGTATTPDTSSAMPTVSSTASTPLLDVLSLIKPEFEGSTKALTQRLIAIRFFCGLKGEFTFRGGNRASMTDYKQSDRNETDWWFHTPCGNDSQLDTSFDRPN